jgi:GGDEF domain-containing protein
VNQRSQQPIEAYLRQSDVQERIRRSIQEARENVTVTISKAASLFGFSESKLREWEKRGLLQTERSILSQDGKGSTGHRQYSSAELDKLAVIHELINRGGYGAADIPPDVDRLWEQIAGRRSLSVPGQRSAAIAPARMGQELQHLPIDKRVELTDREEFWRYFVSQALRLLLMIICEDIPDTMAGLILPLEDRRLARVIHSPADLHQLGPSLVGWLGRNRSFYTFLDEAPGFEFPSDYRLETLTSSLPHVPPEDRVLENVLVVLQRRVRPVSFSPELVETIRRILSLVYQRIDSWQPCFEDRPYNWLYQAHDLERASRVVGDFIFNALLERVIEFGGKTDDGRDRWSFCALLLPVEANLPIQQQNLVVRAQTRNSPYEIGVTTVNPAFTDSLSLKAFQSGQVIYFAETLPGESMTEYQLPAAISHGAQAMNPGRNRLETEPEASTRSAIAIPLLGEYGVSMAVLYVAAKETEAFSQVEQRVLRVMARMVEELLLTSQARRQVVGKEGNAIDSPTVVDLTFQDFGSETDLIIEIVELLKTLQRNEPAQRMAGTSLSVISIDIDNQSRIGTKYGNRVARNLSQQVGFRIRGQMRLSSRYASGKLFHLSADRYCFVLRDISLEETQNLARHLKSILDGTYRILPSSAAPGRPVLPENMLEIKDVTTHLGVSWYPLEKLIELLQRYPEDEAAQRMRALIVAGNEEQLERGKSEGGDRIITWDPEIWGYRRLD